MPVFRMARAQGLRLVALNVASAAMEKVRFGGFGSFFLLAVA
jgi:hypothetical protein